MNPDDDEDGTRWTTPLASSSQRISDTGARDGLRLLEGAGEARPEGERGRMGVEAAVGEETVVSEMVRRIGRRAGRSEPGVVGTAAATRREAGRRVLDKGNRQKTGRQSTRQGGRSTKARTQPTDGRISSASPWTRMAPSCRLSRSTMSNNPYFSARLARSG